MYGVYTVIIILIIVIIYLLCSKVGARNEKNSFCSDPHYLIDNDNPYFKGDNHLMNLTPPTCQKPTNQMTQFENVGDERHIYSVDDSLLSKENEHKENFNSAIDNYYEKTKLY